MKKLFTLFVLSSLVVMGQSNWEQLDVPGGADVNNIFKVSDTIYLCGIQNGSIYRSSDSGANWIKVFNGNNTHSNKGVRSFEFNSNQDIFVGTFANGIRRSTDAGITWLGTNNGGGEIIVNTQSGIMFACDNVHLNWSLSKSLDSGKTWIYLPHPWITGYNGIYAMTTKGNDLFISLADSIVITTDYGTTWSKYGNNVPSSIIHSILFLSENELITGTINGVFYSSDSGNTWHEKNSGIPANLKIIYKLKSFSDRIYACGKAGLLYSTDKGDQWIHYNNYSFIHTIFNATFAEGLTLAATNTGVFKILDDRWENSSRGIYSYGARLLSTASNGELIYNTSVGLFRSYDGGMTWNYIEHDNFFDGCRAIIWKENIYFAQKSNTYFYVSTDYGDSWTNTGSISMGTISMGFSRVSNNVYAGFYRHTPVPPQAMFAYSSDYGFNWINTRGGLYYSLNVLPEDTLFANVFDALFFWKI